MGRSEDLIKLAENDLKVAVLVLNSANDELMQISNQIMMKFKK